MYYIDSSPREPRFVLVPLRFASEAWPRAGLGPQAGLGEPRSASNANKPASAWPLKQGRKKCSKHGCDRGTSTVASGLGTHKEKKVCVDIHVQAAGSQICLQNICGQQRNSPMADPIFGSKYGPQNGVQNWITCSFLLLGLCLGPVLGSRFGPKSGASHRKILLLPADVLQADLRRTSMIVSVNTCFFSLCVPILFLVQSRSLYGRHVSTSFLDPVFGAMMKQACRQTLKSLAAECLVGVRLGLLNFLTPVCVD